MYAEPEWKLLYFGPELLKSIEIKPEKLGKMKKKV